jgi:cell wall-associated NlpC family hydrolase
MSGSTKVGIIAAFAFLLPVVLIAGAAEGVAALFGGGTSLTTCTTGGASGRGGGYRPDQMANATTIVAVGKQMNVPQHGWVVAIAAALQESDLVNVDHGDRDSLGLFQERPSQGWGTPAQVMDPTYAATQFYRHLLAVPGWQQMSVNDAAQAVERSGFPQAYGPHEQAARQIVGAVAGVECTTGSVSPATSGSNSCTTIQAPNPIALAAITYACNQIGLPYQWGGNGPANGDSGFDCSGLTTAAYAAAGITLPRTAQTQYNAGPLLPSGAPLQPGDLVFYGTPRKVHHVAIYIGQDRIIHAPTFGQPVQIASLNLMADFAGASHPGWRSSGVVVSGPK